MISTLVAVFLLNCSSFKEATCPVKSLVEVTPYPTTTTSSTPTVSSSITTFNGDGSDRAFTLITCFFIPTNENSSSILSALGTVNLNLPSKSVAAPKVVPFTKTVAPIIAIESLSTTSPSMTTSFFCSLCTGCTGMDSQITMISPSNL